MQWPLWNMPVMNIPEIYLVMLALSPIPILLILIVALAISLRNHQPPE